MKKRFRVISISILMALLLCGVQHSLLAKVSSIYPEKTKSGGAKVLPTQLQQAYDVKWYFLNLHVQNTSTQLSGDVTIKAEVVSSVMDTFSFHLHNIYTIDSIRVNDVKKNFVRNGDECLLPGLAIPNGTLFDVQVFYNGSLSLGGGFFSGINTETHWAYFAFSTTWTLSEPNSAYHWFPVKQDLNDKADSVWFFATTSNTNKVACNGLLTNTVPLSDNKVRYEWKSQYPTDYYLISFAVANYQDYSFYVTIPQTGDSMLVQNYIYNTPQCLSANKSEIDKTKDMIIYFSELYGAYPFASEKYGHALAPIRGGMEHQTMTTLGFFDEDLIVHELAHQWFGNQVTCSSWEYIWLNEGFASYSVYLWNEFKYGRSIAQNIFDNEERENVFTNGKRGSVYVPTEYIDNENRIFSGLLTYDKGAILVHTLRFEFDNDDLFFEALQAYLQRHSYKTADVNDFQAVMEEFSGKDFTDFFDQWFYGEGYPMFNIAWDTSGDTLLMKSVQTTTASDVTPLFKTLFEMEVIYTDNSRDTIRLLQQDATQYFSLPMLNGRTVSTITFDPRHWLLAQGTVFQGEVSVKEIAKFAFSIYPNPVSDVVNIHFDETSDDQKEIIVTALDGKVVKTVNTTKSIYPLDLSKFASGIYHLQVRSGGQMAGKKLIKL